MKKICFLLLFFPLAAIAQDKPDVQEKIATFTQVWGFLKYYHPAVAKGTQDWDSVFMQRIKKVYTLNSKEAQDNFYAEWIISLGPVEECKRCNTKPEVTYNLDNAWLKDEKIFSMGVSKQLQWIEQNRNQDKNYYVSAFPGVGNTNYANEKPYADSVFPSAEMRLLGLARFWNAAQYFFPYKYVIGRDWKEVLYEMIPAFQHPADTVAYHLAMKQLVASLNDSHAQLNTPYISKWYGYKWVPFSFKLIDNKAVATSFYNDTLCRANDIRIGDAFVSVNGKPVAAIIKEQWKYVGASNDAVKLRGMGWAIFNGNTDSVKVTFERDGVLQEKTIGRYLYPSFHYVYKNGGPDSFRIINDNIGYINLGWLMPDNVDMVMKELKNTKALILDVRNYPNSTFRQLSKYLNDGWKEFAKFTTPNLDHPGAYTFTKPITTGGRSNNYYKGKVILLFNESSQSHAEFTIMALQTAPHVVSIGSQTSGADGNVSYIVLPGNYKTLFTGIGVFYPDGKETQRVGIVPDIVVKPTIAGIRAGRDEVLERSIEEANR
ncbi:MAG: S41 family peptidase [Ferruginibacter sp.]